MPKRVAVGFGSEELLNSKIQKCSAASPRAYIPFVNLWEDEKNTLLEDLASIKIATNRRPSLIS